MLGFDDPDEIGPVGRLLFLLIVWPVMVSLVISFFRGTIGPNRYGPDPLATWP